MCDEAESPGPGRKQREVYLTGASMGGWTVLYYIITYPPTSSTDKILESSSNARTDSTSESAGEGAGGSSMTDIVDVEEAERELKKDDNPSEEREYRPKIAGAFVLCPLVGGKSGL